MSRATHWPHIGLYIAISPPLGHHHSFTTYQYTPILSPQPLQALTTPELDPSTADAIRLTENDPRGGRSQNPQIKTDGSLQAISPAACMNFQTRLLGTRHGHLFHFPVILWKVQTTRQIFTKRFQVSLILSMVEMKPRQYPKIRRLSQISPTIRQTL